LAKTPGLAEASPASVGQARICWAGPHLLDRIVFIDETGLNTKWPAFADGLQKGDVVVMHSLPAYRGAAANAAIRQSGA